MLSQTRRHTYLCSLLGIKDYIIAINKMDLIQYNKKIFDTISKAFSDFAKILGIKKFVVIPVSGLKGDNIVKKSKSAKWYKR